MPAAPPPPAPASEPDEFTRLMNETPTPARQPTPGASDPTGPGEFTRLMQAAAPEAPPASAASSRVDSRNRHTPRHCPRTPPAAAPPPAPPAARPGDFTRLMQTGQAPSQQPLPARLPRLPPQRSQADSRTR